MLQGKPEIQNFDIWKLFLGLKMPSFTFCIVSRQLHVKEYFYLTGVWSHVEVAPWLTRGFSKWEKVEKLGLLESDRPKFKSQVHDLLTVWPWASHLSSPCLSFFRFHANVSEWLWRISNLSNIYFFFLLLSPIFSSFPSSCLLEIILTSAIKPLLKEADRERFRLCVTVCVGATPLRCCGVKTATDKELTRGHARLHPNETLLTKPCGGIWICPRSCSLPTPSLDSWSYGDAWAGLRMSLAL